MSEALSLNAPDFFGKLMQSDFSWKEFFQKLVKLSAAALDKGEGNTSSKEKPEQLMKGFLSLAILRSVNRLSACVSY